MVEDTRVQRESPGAFSGTDISKPDIWTTEPGVRRSAFARNPVAGVVLLVFGVAGLIFEVNYSLGTSRGVTQAVLGALFPLFLTFIGAAFLQGPTTAARRWTWRAAWAALVLFAVGAGVAFFHAQLFGGA